MQASKLKPGLQWSQIAGIPMHLKKEDKIFSEKHNLMIGWFFLQTIFFKARCSTHGQTELPVVGLVREWVITSQTKQSKQEQQQKRKQESNTEIIRHRLLMKKICLLMFTKLKCTKIDLGKNHKEIVDLKTGWELPVKKNDKSNTKDFCLQSPEHH